MQEHTKYITAPILKTWIHSSANHSQVSKSQRPVQGAVNGVTAQLSSKNQASHTGTV